MGCLVRIDPRNANSPEELDEIERHNERYEFTVKHHRKFRKYIIKNNKIQSVKAIRDSNESVFLGFKEQQHGYFQVNQFYEGGWRLTLRASLDMVEYINHGPILWGKEDLGIEI